MFGLNLDNNYLDKRQEKSLLNTFPFNVEHDHHQHGHHGQHEQDHPSPHHQQRPFKRNNVKTEKNNLFPFKAAQTVLKEDNNVSIEDFIDEEEEEEGVEESSGDQEMAIMNADINEVNDEKEDSKRRCIDKVSISIYAVACKDNPTYSVGYDG